MAERDEWAATTGRLPRRDGEPGAYSPALNAGIRLENTFLVTDSGCELLSDYPVSLT